MHLTFPSPQVTLHTAPTSPVTLTENDVISLLNISVCMVLKRSTNLWFECLPTTSDPDRAIVPVYVRTVTFQLSDL